MAFTEHIKVALGLESSLFKKGLSGAESKAKSFGKNVKGYLAGALGVGILVRTTKAIVDFGATIGDVSDRIGVSAEFLQEFQYSATQSGSSAEEASKALEKLSKSVGEAEIGTKLYVDAFDRLGVSLRDADGNLKSTEQVTKEVANGLQAIDDPAIKVKTAFDLMGRSGTAMIQVMMNGEKGLNKFGKEARDMGMIVGNENVKALQDASGKIEILNRSWKVFLAEIATPVTNALQFIMTGIKGLKLAIESVPIAIELFAKAFNKMTHNIKVSIFTDIMLKLEKLKLGFAEFNPFADDSDVKRYQANIEKLQRKQVELNSRVMNMADAKAEVLAEDDKLFERADKLGKKNLQLNKEIRSVFEKKKKVQVEINQETSKQDAILDKVLNKTSEEETNLSRIVERQQAFNKGGIQALEIVESRFKMEDQIQKLLKDGTLTQNEAEKKAKSIIEVQEQELKLQEAIKLEKEKQVSLKERKEDREKLLSDLDKEIDQRHTLQMIDQAIVTARKQGNKEQEQILENRKIAIQLREVGLDQQAQVQAQLEAELEQKKEIRKNAQLELDILQARANGNNELADRLEFQIELQKNIKEIADAQNLTQEEAIRLVEQKLGIEHQLEEQQIKANKKALLDANVLNLAKMRLSDAEDREERKRILAAQSVQRLNTRIAELREKGGAFSDKEIARLEALKAKKLEFVLDDKTKEELKKLEVKEQDLQAEQEMRMQEMKKEFRKIKDEEAKQKEANKKQIEALEAKKQELLDEQKEVATELKEGVKDQGEAVVDQLNETGESIVDSMTSQVDVLDQIKKAIQEIQIPSFSSSIAGTNSPLIDVSSLATESTLSDINLKLQGKLRNE